MDYQTFKAEAERNGLKDVTEAEWKDHAPDPGAGKNWSLMTALRRVRNARKGIGAPRELKTVIGYALGGREFLPADNDINKSWKQFIPVLSPGHGITEVDVEGTFKAPHGVKLEIRYEESQVAKKDGEGYYTNRTVQECVVGKDSLTLDIIKKAAIEIDSLDVSMAKSPVIIKGVISDSWYPEKIFENREPTGEWPMWLNDAPVFQVNLKGGQKNIVKVRFPPRKISKPLIAVDDFLSVAQRGDLNEMKGSFNDVPVYVAGVVSRWEDQRSRDGRNFVQIIATGIWAIPDEGEPAQQTKIDEPKPAPAAQPALQTGHHDTGGPRPDLTQAPPTPAPAVTPPPAQVVKAPMPGAAVQAPAAPAAPAPARPTTMKEKVELVKAGVQKAATVLGGADKLTTQNCIEVNKDIWTWGPSHQTIQIAIDKLKDKK